MPVFRQPDSMVSGNAVENNHTPPGPAAPLPSQTEPQVEKVVSPVTEVPTTRPTESEYLLSSAVFYLYYFQFFLIAGFKKTQARLTTHCEVHRNNPNTTFFILLNVVVTSFNMVEFS